MFKIYFFLCAILVATIVNAQPSGTGTSTSTTKNPKEGPGKTSPVGVHGDPQNKTTSSSNTKSKPKSNGEIAKEVSKSVIEKYTSTWLDISRNNYISSLEGINMTHLNANSIPSVGTKVNIGIIAGNIFKITNLIQTINDVNNGEWGSAVCFSVGLIPFPYGTAASIVCETTLVTYRISKPQPILK